ncbi:cleavage stimulation factor subunit 2 isoform X1 [Hydra vulgaris]|uniref:Cleavage stimulation factor subunit 2 n=1 Tax=Hydra vulgaris TaxID=6087 RepID=T2MG84_HYDVU|nr:cleavage stimulation factor subunit 2 isoform X1 [Hydra vulgaris]
MAAIQVREISAVKDQQMKEAAEKSARSVFVGNIPYEASDDQLKDIFSQAGPVLSFRLVYDRETGKPKGYGFCEYKDSETAQSAMRNLNGTEIHGRQLRVDSAASQKGNGVEDPKAFMKEISPYGQAVNPDKAPETITNAVASLPPEQMFELMKQMKLCIQNNPEEARQMLLQNPQLAYALLQAQVIMKIVDPKVAEAILHQPRGEPLPINQLMEQAGIGPGSQNVPPPIKQEWRGDLSRDITFPPRGEIYRGPAPDIRGEFGRPPVMERDMMRGPPLHEREFRPPSIDDRRGPPIDDRFRESGPPPFDPRDRPVDRHPNDPRGPPPLDQRMRMDGLPGRDERGIIRDDRINRGPPPSRDNRDPRPGPPMPHEMRGPPPTHHGGPSNFNAPPTNHVPPPTSQFDGRPQQKFTPSQGTEKTEASTGTSGTPGPNKEEKERLIMQVLNLTDAQINMLPEDQRESIRLLKAQFANKRN